MKKYEIYRRAWLETLGRWAREKDILDKNPNAPIAKAKAARYWAECEELGELMRIEEAKGATE